MKKEKFYGINNSKTIENHQTAAWANIKDLDPVSRVPMPSKEGVDDAKGWVDENEK